VDGINYSLLEGVMIDIASLTREERVELMSRIWQSLTVEPQEIKLSAEQEAILDRRVAKLDANGPVGIPASEVLARLRADRV
jgi:putative addiction module component (TIGR02574 family)